MHSKEEEKEKNEEAQVTLDEAQSLRFPTTTFFRTTFLYVYFFKKRFLSVFLWHDI